MDAGVIAAWYGAGLSTVVAVVGGVSKWRGSKSRLRVLVTRGILTGLDVPPTIVIVEVINDSNHDVQVSDMGIEAGDTGPAMRCAFSKVALGPGAPHFVFPAILPPRQSLQQYAEMNAVTYDFTRPIQGWAKLATQEVFRSDPTVLSQAPTADLPSGPNVW